MIGVLRMSVAGACCRGADRGRMEEISAIHVGPLETLRATTLRAPACTVNVRDARIRTRHALLERRRSRGDVAQMVRAADS